MNPKSNLFAGHRVAVAGDAPYPYIRGDILNWIKLHGGTLTTVGPDTTVLILGDDPGAARLRVRHDCHLVSMADVIQAAIGRRPIDIPKAKQPAVELPDNYGVF